MDSLPIVVVGFLLGMLHATDADHVIAVSTIVSRQGNVRSAASIGALWGVGHTLTVFLVGGAIILFSLVIPPRVGLGMEFAVAVMLILLGVYTLSGVTRWVRDNMFPAPDGSFPGHSHAATQPAAHLHPHVHGDYVHVHPHGHAADNHGHQESATPQAWLDRRLSGTARAIGRCDRSRSASCMGWQDPLRSPCLCSRRSGTRFAGCSICCYSASGRLPG